MGELIDLIIDFEKGIVRLLRDILFRPKDVAEAIVNKEKKYTPPFKFFSLILSLWIILSPWDRIITLGSIEGGIIPLSFEKYLSSFENFILLAAPFIVLIEFFIPVALINYFLSRGKNFSLSNHLSLNIYLAGLYLLYNIPIVLLFGRIAYNSLIFYFNIGPILLMFIVPIVHYGLVHVKMWGKPKFLNFLKVTLPLCLVTWISTNYIANGPVHELIHKKIYYFSKSKIELKESKGDYYKYVFQEKINGETTDYLPLVGHYRVYWGASATRSQNGHSFLITGDIVENDDSVSLDFNFCSRTDTIRRHLLNTLAFERPFISINQIDPYRVLILSAYKNERVIWEVTSKGNFLHKFNGGHLLNSTMPVAFNYIGDLFISGFDTSKDSSYVSKLSLINDSFVFTSYLNLPNYKISDLDEASDSTIVSLYSVDKFEKLSEIHLVSFQIIGFKTKVINDILLYKNVANPTTGLLRRPRVYVKSKNEVFTSYQLMNDSTFVTHVTSHDLTNETINWERNIKIKSDFAIVDKILFDNKHIFLLGRAASIFRKDFSLRNYELPFVKVIDDQNGNELGTFFLEKESNTIDNIENMYSEATSAYQDDKYIYFAIDSNHFYQIDKKLITIDL